MNELFVQALPILKKIEHHGYEAVFVGGSVRDYLLHREINDVDIATSATPEEVKAIFPKTIDVGIQHGTVMVLENGQTYEITTYRSESEYIDFRKPKEVTFIRSLKEDLQRRDFTMNAIAMNTSGQLIDHFHGQQAIENGIIETVGHADERFGEDALRMMRALRFVSQLNFTCSKETLQALEKNKHLLHNISVERILVELDKLLQGPQVQQALNLLIETGLYAYLPGLQHKKKLLQQVAQFDLRQLTSLEEKWAVIVHYVVSVDDVESFLRSWKMSVKRIRQIEAIVRLLAQKKNDHIDRLQLFTNGVDCMLSVSRVYNFLHYQEPRKNDGYIEEMWGNLPIQHLSQLAINGHHLLQWTNKAKGPWIRDVMQLIVEKVIKEEIPNEVEAIKEEVHRCNLI
ncbi:MAG: CCA tRNA nucleotidyltransferase [Bacillus sp. (in: firmicutes)]